MSHSFRDKHRAVVPDAAPLDEGNIPRPPTRPGAVLLVMALVAACGLLYLLLMAAPSPDTGTPTPAASRPS
jgi:hypothetical protein